MKKGVLMRLRKLSGLLLCCAIMAINYSQTISALRDMSDDIHIQANDELRLPITPNGFLQASMSDEAVEVSMLSGETLAQAIGQSGASSITISLFGVIPVKNINVHMRDDVLLVPGGSSIGVTLLTRGALVVGVGNVTLESGDVVSPAAASGIQAGDLIETANGIEIKDAKHLAEICNKSTSQIELELLRGGERIKTLLHPVFDSGANQYRMGMWVRDSTAGVGTLSFYDPNSNRYGALGHAITDIDTRANLTVREGEIFQSSIVDIVHGARGEPGELRGTFNSSSKPLGTIEKNDQFGIFGSMYESFTNALYPSGLLMAYPEEACVGPARILTTLDDDGIKAYDCEIIKINPQSSPAQKGMVLEVTDTALLNATGGIVQGMSGSPVIQNNKLIGVVTHVFINDPTKGYCMYALWMQQQIAL